MIILFKKSLNFNYQVLYVFHRNNTIILEILTVTYMTRSLGCVKFQWIQIYLIFNRNKMCMEKQFSFFSFLFLYSLVMSLRKFFVGGNWKMNGNQEMVKNLTQQLNEIAENTKKSVGKENSIQINNP